MHNLTYDEAMLMASMKRCNLTLNQAILAMEEYRNRLDFENALDEAYENGVAGKWKDEDVL